jgi:DNA mismatch endonuclease (patch repair protein)
MTDVFTRKRRSEVMARIRGRGNKATELALAKLLRAHHISGWRRHTVVFGKPDFVFRRERLAVFVDGCFWHGCPRCYRRPGTNQNFWDKKFMRNRTRDRLVNRTLQAFGWRVLRIWEHEFKKPESVVAKLRSTIRVVSKLTR